MNCLLGLRDAHRRLRRILGLCALALLGSPAALPGATAPASTGTLVGTVTSTGTQNALQGAVVTIPALSRSELTDNTGSFAFSGLPAGAVELVLSYTGFNDERRTAAIRAGETSRLAVALTPTPAITMEAFTVSAEREGHALAATEQRNADNIKTVAAIDSWGNMPNMSVGELAMRLPGMTFQLDSDDVVMNVSIRGMSTDFTRLSIDGMSSTSVAGNGRTASLHSFSGALYEQVEVVSGVLPDSSADSIGGSVNLKTRSSFSMGEKRRINYSIGARWAPPFFYRTPERAERNLHHSVSFSYSERFSIRGGRNNLGVSVSLAQSENVNPFNIRIFDYQATTNAAAYLRDFQTFSGMNNRHLTAVNLKADYKYSDASKFSVSLIYNRGAEPSFDRNVIQASTASTTPTVGTAATAQIVPGYTESRTEIRPVTGSNFDISQAHWSFFSDNPTVTFSGDHRWGRLVADYAARYSYTHFDSGTGKTGPGKASGGQLTMRVPGIGFVLDKSDPDGRVFTQTAGPSVYDLSSYTSNLVFTKRDSISDVPEVSANANAALTLPTRLPFTVKTGVNFRRRGWETRQRDTRRWNRTAGAPPLPAVFVPLSTFDLRQGGPRIPAVDVRALNDELSNPALWTEDLVYRAQQKYVSNRNATEEIQAGYVRLTTRLQRLGLTGGLRVENTEIQGYTFLKFRSTTVAQEPDPFKRAALDYGDVSNRGDYRRSFPSLHATYDLAANLKARASWSTSFARPNFVSLIPTATVNEAQQTVTGSNPGLGPQYARNLDAKLEYYFKPAGLLSVGYFKKNIRDYIVTQEVGIVPFGPDNGFDGFYEGYRFFTSVNGGTANVRGWEFDYRQQFTFLPGLLRGLGLMANYTRLETEGDFGGTYRRTDEITGFTPRSANVSLTYTYRGFTARVTTSYTGRIITTYSANEANRVYRKPITTTNLNLSYRVHRHANLFCDVSNLLETGPSFYRYIPARLRETRFLPSAVTFGVNGQF
ncbi:MAG: TonB-dependent receptor [Verrucomicrobia bacterium]|nr:TonB-dependent receptor [Verrucomicrobiota bacterium]